jgi:hypothetical protein
VTDEELTESLDRHFLLNLSLSTAQLLEHRASGTCRECRERAAASTVKSAATKRSGHDG